MKLIGDGVDRADGRAKVTGTARYSAENAPTGFLYGAIVMSTIANGRIANVDDAEASKLPGVVRVFTQANAPKLKNDKPQSETIWRVLPVLQDDDVRYDRQPIALVVADSYERAVDAATRVVVTYAKSDPATSFETSPSFPAPDGQVPSEKKRGDADSALASADVRVDNVYRTPQEFHNAMEPHAAVAEWTQGKLTIFDATQGVFPTRERLAYVFDIAEDDVHVISPFIGGGFGSKGSVWAHTVLAAMAARELKRPVKIALERPQMFGGVGYRPITEQRVALGATKDGKLVSTIHEVKSNTSSFDMFVEPSTSLTMTLYDVPNLRTKQTIVRLNSGTPTFARAPGESSGSFALESAMDELAYALAINPLELRLRNYAEIEPDKQIPFSSKSLRACYAKASEAFGWSKRTAAPMSMREGNDLIGYGMATAVYPTHRSKAAASVHIAPDGSVVAAAGTQELGTGSYTIYAQIAADVLGIDSTRVRFELGDTKLPETPVSGGSQTTASVGSAVFEAAQNARANVIALAIADSKSPLYNATPSDVTSTGGSLALMSNASKTESYADLIKRVAPGGIEGRAQSAPREDDEKKHAMFAFGAQFVEVRVDADTNMVRVARMTGAFASGRIVNRKTAHSQYIGGMTWAIGMALHEGAHVDRRTGRVMNANLGEYLVPVNADVPALEAIFIEEEDPYVNPIGVKGIGEIGIVGGAAAIANAIYHATGKRIRSLPIHPEHLLS